MAIEHKFVSVTNKSDTIGISNADTNVFQSSNHSGSVDISYTADSSGTNTFNSSTGEITVGDGGNYFVIFSCFLDVPTSPLGDRTPTLKIKINNSTVAQYTPRFEVGTGAVAVNGLERTLTYFGSISPNDKVTATLVSDSSNASGKVLAERGTTLTVIKSGDSYAVATKISRTPDVTTFHNPFITGTLNTDYVINKSSDFSLTGSENDFKYTTTGSAKAFYVSENFILTSSTDTTATITMYRNNATTVNTTAVRVSPFTGQGNAPPEANIAGLQIMSNSNLVRGRMSIGTGGSVLSGSSFIVFEVNDENYISVRQSADSSTIATGSSDILVKSASNLTPTSPTGTSYNSGSGVFTVNSDGYYFITANLVLQTVTTSGDAQSVSFTIRKNNSSCSDGTVLLQSNCRIDGDGDPIETTLVGVYSLNANDTISICGEHAAGNSVGFTTKLGTSLTMFKIGSLPGGGGGGGGGGTVRITSFGGRTGGFSIGSFGSPTSGRTVGNGFF